MTIRSGQIVEGSETPVGDGVAGACRSLIRLEDGQLAKAVSKQLDERGCAAEIYCSVLCKGWGLEVPEVAIVTNRANTIASIDDGYPSLKQRIGWSDNLPPDIKQVLEHHGAHLISSFPDTPTALAVDEAVNNRDRNFGNVLWDGSNVSWIDHERTLGFDKTPDVNLLAEMAVATGNADRVRAAAVAMALALAQEVIDETRAKLMDYALSIEFTSFVSERYKTLSARILDRFPKPPDLLNC